MLQIGFGLVERGNGKLLCHSTVTKASDLRKDEPDPVAGLSPSPELSNDCVIDVLLRVEKALEIVADAHKLSAARYILSRTTSCLVMLDCKT